ncbi:hypothetical protein HMPREF0670_01655 [Prevotella sp. oral taxon 317 str. F0108]|nr:hypothetical protein HMPREF0670_01655 [Prevotella sp. oral taxon 317 str. F0108]
MRLCVLCWAMGDVSFIRRESHYGGSLACCNDRLKEKRVQHNNTSSLWQQIYQHG